MGTTTPYPPRSSAFLMKTGSLPGTRINGVTSVPFIARTISSTVSQPAGPCSASITSQSIPKLDTNSAMGGDGRLIHWPMARCPSSRCCLVLLVNTCPPHGAYTSGLARCAGRSPRNTARTSSAIDTAMRCNASSVCAAACGVSTVLGAESNG